MIDLIKQFIQNDFIRAIIAAVIIVIATAIIAHLLTRLIRRLMHSELANMADVPAASLLVNVERIVVWGLGVSLMLSACFDINVTALIAALGIGGIALSLGLQDTIKNFLGGIQMTAMRIIKPGEWIGLDDVKGIVQDVNWRQTTVRNIDGVEFVIPNATISSATISRGTPPNLVTAPFSVANECSDLQSLGAEMERLAKVAIEKVAPLERDPWVLFYEISEFGANGKLLFILKSTDKAREARDAALRAIAHLCR